VFLIILQIERLLKLLRIPHAMERVITSLTEQRLQEERDEQLLNGFNPVQVADVNASVKGWLAQNGNEFNVAHCSMMEPVRRFELRFR
jgi:hypothetical protein